MGKLLALVAGLALGVLIVAICAIVGAWLTTVIWQWVVPDVFAGAVAHGMLPASLGMGQAIKLVILIGALFGGIKTASSNGKSE